MTRSLDYPDDFPRKGRAKRARRLALARTKRDEVVQYVVALADLRCMQAIDDADWMIRS